MPSTKEKNRATQAWFSVWIGFRTNRGSPSLKHMHVAELLGPESDQFRRPHEVGCCDLWLESQAGLNLDPFLPSSWSREIGSDWWLGRALSENQMWQPRPLEIADPGAKQLISCGGVLFRIYIYIYIYIGTPFGDQA